MPPKVDRLDGLAFDLSKTNTGVVALSRNGRIIAAHQRSYARLPYFGDVLLAFERDLLHFLSDRPYAWIAYEEVRPINKYHSELHFGMVGILAMRACQHEIPLVGANTGSMRKNVLGRGRLIKDEVLAAVHAKLPEPERKMIVSHDLADAWTVGQDVLSRLI